MVLIATAFVPPLNANTGGSVFGAAMAVLQSVPPREFEAEISNTSAPEFSALPNLQLLPPPAPDAAPLNCRSAPALEPASPILMLVLVSV